MNVSKESLQVISWMHGHYVYQTLSPLRVGRDFDLEYTQLTVEAQVDKLIHDATSIENLSQLFLGWYVC